MRTLDILHCLIPHLQVIHPVGCRLTRLVRTCTVFIDVPPNAVLVTLPRSSNTIFWTNVTCWANRRPIARFLLLLSGMRAVGGKQTTPTK